MYKNVLKSFLNVYFTGGASYLRLKKNVPMQKDGKWCWCSQGKRWVIYGNWKLKYFWNKNFHQISRDYSTQKISVVALAVLSSLRFVSVGDNAEYIQSIATFQINARRANLFRVIVYFARLIHEEDGERLIFRLISGFFCSLKIELNLYTWYPLFSLWFKNLFFTY